MPGAWVRDQRKMDDGIQPGVLVGLVVVVGVAVGDCDSEMGHRSLSPKRSHKWYGHCGA